MKLTKELIQQYIKEELANHTLKLNEQLPKPEPRLPVPGQAAAAETDVEGAQTKTAEAEAKEESRKVMFNFAAQAIRIAEALIKKRTVAAAAAQEALEEATREQEKAEEGPWGGAPRSLDWKVEQAMADLKDAQSDLAQSKQQQLQYQQMLEKHKRPLTPEEIEAGKKFWGNIIKKGKEWLGIGGESTPTVTPTDKEQSKQQSLPGEHPPGSGMEPQQSMADPIPKPRRIAGMSVKYLEKRGYTWDPNKGTMIHPKKGDVRDVASKWKSQKRSRRKRIAAQNKMIKRLQKSGKKVPNLPTGPIGGRKQEQALQSRIGAGKKLKENKQTNTDLLTESEIKRFAEIMNTKS